MREITQYRGRRRSDGSILVRIGEASRRLWKGNLERREVKLLGLLRRYEVMTIWKVGIGLRFSLSRKFMISDFAHLLTRAELEQAISNVDSYLCVAGRMAESRGTA